MQIQQKIVILGQPNVGKSSLFNRLIKDRIAITSELEGTTRDINIRQIALNYNDKNFYASLCDTAGLIKKADGIFEGVKKAIFDFISDEDIILFVISANSGISDEDIKLFRMLKNAVLVINKIDIETLERWEYEAFNAKNIFFISSLHNRGIKQLKDFLSFYLSRFVKYDEVLESLEKSQDSSKSVINIGIIGRVNVGKSSILNALLDKNRAVVSEIEGTTIDPVSDDLIYKDKILHFVDTAGIRRASKIEGIEKFALQRTKSILEASDIVLLVLDASKDFVELDEKISGLSQKYHLGVIILLNKWDIKRADFKTIQSELKRKFAYLSYAPILTISALKMRHIEEIKEMIMCVWDNFHFRIPTSILNEHIKISTQKHPIPSDKGKLVKIYYGSQVDSAPPQIVLVSNKPKAIHFSYKRYLVNYLRANFDFSGVPILISIKGRNKDENNDKNNDKAVEQNHFAKDLVKKCKNGDLA